MPRRRSGLQPLHLAGAVGVLAIAGGAFWLFARNKGDKMEGDPFSGGQYSSNQVMRGSSYLLTGTVVEQLRFGADGSRLFSIEKKEEGSSETTPVGVLVPPKFNDINIQVGQEFHITVVPDIDGVLRATAIRKS